MNMFFFLGHLRFYKLLATFLLGLFIGSFLMVRQTMPLGALKVFAPKPMQLSSMNSHHHAIMTRDLRKWKFTTLPLPRWKPLRAYAGPEPAELSQSRQQVTVALLVPPATKAADVNVKFLHDRLYVAVKGHEAQPSLIDGELTCTINPQMSFWTLDGSGDNRKLILELEKQNENEKWVTLLKANGLVKGDIPAANSKEKPNIEESTLRDFYSKPLVKPRLQEKDDSDWRTALDDLRDIQLGDK